MFKNVCFCVILLNLLQLCVLGEWIEIPQSVKKSYLVTPYSPYIYTPSLVFTSTTTESYETMRPLSRPRIKVDTKKVFSQMTETVVQKTTTDFPSPGYHSNANKFNSTKPKVDKRFQRPQINNHQKNSPNVSSSSTEIPHLSDKNFQITNEEEVEELEEEYEQVYDDDEDHYVDDNEEDDEEDMDENDEALNEPVYEYYDDEEYDDDIPVEEAKGNSYSQPNPEEHSNGFSYASFLPYLQNIQSTLIRTSHTSTVNNKVSFLNDIKNRLLYAIQSRINSIWEPRGKRQKRTTRGDMWESWDKGDHGMEFPSNEGALLTLGFLTFAVFLIKCILKLIHQIKGKHHNSGMTQIIIQNGTAAPAMNTFRFKRDIDDLEIAKFMATLDSYKPH